MRSWITKLWGGRAPNPLSMEANNTVKGANPRSSGPASLIQDVWKYTFLIHCVLSGEVLLIPVVFNGSLVYKDFVVFSGFLGKFYNLHYFGDLWDCFPYRDTSHLHWLCWSHIYGLIPFCAFTLRNYFWAHPVTLKKRTIQLHPFPPEVSHLSHREAIGTKQLAFLMSSLILEKKNKIGTYTTNVETIVKAHLCSISVRCHWVISNEVVFHQYQMHGQFSYTMGKTIKPCCEFGVI